MNLYELFSLFWRDNGYRAFSKTETILYFYLLNMANSARWQMRLQAIRKESVPIFRQQSRIL